MTKEEFTKKIDGYSNHRVIFMNGMILYTEHISIEPLLWDCFYVRNLEGDIICIKDYSDIDYVIVSD